MIKERDITYNPNKNSTREKLANPYSNSTIKDRIIKAGALDLKDNHRCINFEGGYCRIIPLKDKKLER